MINFKLKLPLVLLLICSALVLAANEQQPIRPWLRPSQRASRTQQQQQQQSSPQTSSVAPATIGTGSAVEVAPPANQPTTLKLSPPIATQPAAASSTVIGTNRTTRTTGEVFQGGEGYNIFVTNTCERESMKVNIKTSRPFYGVIHTRNHRQKPNCLIEGNGGTDYNLEISHVINSQDPAHCGVIKAKKESPEDKDLLSVVVAVRFHRNIELLDDKFFLLNCTNRCRKPDCSNPSANLVARPNDLDDVLTGGGGGLEREGPSRDTLDTNQPIGGGASNDTRQGNEDECTIYKFPWVITLLWCLGILLLAMIISHCIMCSSLVCKCVKTEVEEREPSIYEGATDYEDDTAYNKRHPYRIDYDNKDIYKTSNNYAPYSLEEAQAKSRRKNNKHKKQGSNRIDC